MRDGDHREVLDRVDLRLYEQGDTEANPVGDDGPDTSQDAFHPHGNLVLTGAEQEPFIDGVKDHFDVISVEF